jgi:pseudouridine synthase
MDGKVKVNGMQTKYALADVVMGEDMVTVGNLKVFPSNKFSVPNLWIANKLPNEKLSFKPGLQKDISIFRRFENSDVPTNLVPINALDFIGEGLCLLTDDSEFAYYMNRPFGNKPLEKEYRVRVHGLVNQSKLNGMKYGITVDGTSYKPFQVEVESTPVASEAKRKGSDEGLSKSANSWLRIVTTDSHPRGVKNVLERMFIKVNRLICTRVDQYRVTKSPGTGNRDRKKKPTAAGDTKDDGNGASAMPLPGQIVGPISILHNKYLASSPTQRKSAEGHLMDVLQQNLLSYLFIQQTNPPKLGRNHDDSGKMHKSIGQKISSSPTLRF